MILKEFTVPENANGLRIDTLIRKMLPDIDPYTIKRSFSDKDVKIDGKRVKPDMIVSAGQIVGIYIKEPVIRKAYLDIVYEDEDILIVNKRSGISVDRDLYGSHSLLSVCREYLGNDHFIEACHRLDNQTSGLCLFAKNQNAYEILVEVFRTRKLEKHYVCLVRGMMKPQAAICRAWLKKDSEHSRVAILDHFETGAFNIITEYETIDNNEISRLRVHLITGRTHQIRAHLAALGHPILGDDLYGDRVYNRETKTQHKLKLCAVSLRLDTGGLLPDLDGRLFSIEPPF